MPADALLVGLDAMEPDLIARWADAGHLPTFASLRRDGVRVDVTSPVPGIRAGAWPEVNSGISVARTGMFNVGIPQYFPREGVFRDLRRDEIETDDLFWIQAAKAGKKVAAIDQVYTAADDRSTAVQLVDWGVHDRPFPPSASPPRLIADTEDRHGPYPVQDCDALHGARHSGYEELVEVLERAAEVKTDVLTGMLRRDRWDLVAGMFSEPHCAGHQMWHLHEPFDPAHTDSELADALLRVYRAVDTGLGRVLEEAGPDAYVLVIANKGMGPNLGGYQLIPEFLHRLGVGASRRWRRKLWDQVPGALKARMLKAMPQGVRDPARKKAALGAEAGFVGDAQALSIRNDQDSAVRINLVGRDIAGNVAPGEQADALLDEIRTELLNLRLPSRPDQAIVESVEITEETLGSDRSELIPDLLVLFRKDLGILDACESDRVGRIALPVAGIRTGNHTSRHQAWVMGPGLEAGGTHAARTIDFAPTILSRLGVPIPDAVDGAVLPQLGGTGS